MPHHILLNLRHVFLEDLCTHRFWRQELDTLCWGSGQGYYPHDCNFHSFFLLILQLLIILLLPLFLSCHSLFIKRKNKSEVAQSCPTLCDPMDTRLLRPWDFLGKSTGVGCHFRQATIRHQMLFQVLSPASGANAWDAIRTSLCGYQTLPTLPVHIQHPQQDVRAWLHGPKAGVQSNPSTPHCVICLQRTLDLL